jgi:phospholipid transport system substrate-binding protein
MLQYDIYGENPVTTTRRRLFAAAVALGAVSFAGVPAGATDDPAAFIETAAKRVLEILKTSPDATARNDALIDLFRTSFDMANVGRAVLGVHWARATPDQRERFLKVFEQAEIRAYAERFQQNSGYGIKIGRTSRNGDATLVDSQLVPPDGSEPVRVVWEVKNLGTGLRITDVSVEGVSMAITRRSDFNAYISRNNGSLDALIAELKRKSGG